jgi:hypothetical protein
MPASDSARPRLSSGFATVCLVLIELSQFACGRDRPPVPSTSADRTDTLPGAVGEGGAARGGGAGYDVVMRVRQQAEKLGPTFDVTYDARLAPGPDGELQGSGTYKGFELSWTVACSDLHPNPETKKHLVSGKLNASGSAVDMGSGTVLMFTLETLDFPPPHGWSGEGDEQTRGRGTVGNLGVTLTGPVTTDTVKSEGGLMGFSSETPCTGKFSNTQETTVRVK